MYWNGNTTMLCFFMRQSTWIHRNSCPYPLNSHSPLLICLYQTYQCHTPLVLIYQQSYCSSSCTVKVTFFFFFNVGNWLHHIPSSQEWKYLKHNFLPGMHLTPEWLSTGGRNINTPTHSSVESTSAATMYRMLDHPGNFHWWSKCRQRLAGTVPR